MSKQSALRQAVEEINVPCFLLCGTLLGAMRDGELMDWDHDVDIGIWEYDRYKLDSNSMSGWSVECQRAGHDLIGWEYRLNYSGVSVDLFFLHQTDEGCWFNVGGKYHYHYPRIEEITTVEIDGCSYNVPANWEECLVANYGPDWRKPQKEWDWKKAPCCKEIPNMPKTPDVKKILLVQPSYGQVTSSAANSFYRASSGKLQMDGQSHGVKVDTLASQSSLLANNFNRAWCAGLNGDYDYFAMLHADITCSEFWLDTMIEELERYDFDVLSAVVPIKSMKGTTSTAVDGGDRWHPACRLTMREAFALPVTFTAEDVGYPLLLNTGCWVVKWGDWCKDVCFHIYDQIIHNGKEYIAEVESEDWNFSRQLNDLGLRIGATRIIETRHVGAVEFVNSLAYGDEYDHAWDLKGSLVLEDFLPSVDGWLTKIEGDALREMAEGCEVLEIGTYCGRSTICLAQSAESVVSIDPHDGRGTSKPRYTLEECRDNLTRYGVLDKVTLLLERPSSIEPIDLAFIDGAHDRENVEADLEYAKQHLRKDGLIAFHDYGQEPGVTAAVDNYLQNGGTLLCSFGSIAVVKP